RDRNFERDRLLRIARSDRDISRALLPIAFERIAANGSPKKQQIIEMRQFSFGPSSADVVDASRRCTPDLCNRMLIEGRRFPGGSMNPAFLGGHQSDPTLSMWKL